MENPDLLLLFVIETLFFLLQMSTLGPSNIVKLLLAQAIFILSLRSEQIT